MAASADSSDYGSGCVYSVLSQTAAKAPEAAMEAHEDCFPLPKDASLLMSSQQQPSYLLSIEPQRHDDDGNGDYSADDEKWVWQKQQDQEQHRQHQHQQQHSCLYSTPFQQDRSGQTASSCINPNHHSHYPYQQQYNLSNRGAFSDMQLLVQYRQDTPRFISDNKTSPVYRPMKIPAALEQLARLMERRTAAYI